MKPNILQTLCSFISRLLRFANYISETGFVRDNRSHTFAESRLMIFLFNFTSASF